MGIIRGFIAIGFLAVSPLAFAAERHLPVPQWPLPQVYQTSPSRKFPVSTFSDKNSVLPAADAGAIAAELKKQLDASLVPLSSAAPACSAPGAGDYTLALRVAGRLEECARYAKTCAADLISPRALWIGAACEMTQGNYTSAKGLYQTAASAKYETSADYAEAVYRYAEVQPGQTSDILKLNTSWSEQERGLWAAVIQRVYLLDYKPYTKAEVDGFLNAQIANGRGGLPRLLKLERFQIAAGEYKYSAALKLLVADMGSFPDPLWYARAYSIVYRAFDTGFAEARKIYDAFDPYANWTWDMPTEDNTYNYTQIYNDICRDSLLQGEDLNRFAQFKERLRRGELSPAQALNPIEIFAARFPGKADVLTTYAGILALLDRHAEAIATYWKAHRACRYYNRANWGLELEQRHISYVSMPDYAENAARVEREVASRPIPPEISGYVVNWNALTSAAQVRVEYGARIWLPYMKQFRDNQFTTYIKFAFDLLSESPGMSAIKDERIGGTGYPNDNRLWDDVRGAGGETVVADLGEMYEAVQGEYNLLGHEMTHQFQKLLEQKSSAGIACVESLYAAAKARGVFPDPYAAQNKEEYFAQGVTYYLVPADSPARFGLNQSWLETGDAALLGFIRTIDGAAGNLEKISCGPAIQISAR